MPFFFTSNEGTKSCWVSEARLNISLKKQLSRLYKFHIRIMLPKPKVKREIMIRHTSDRNNLPVEVTELNIKERVYLGSLLRTGLSEIKKSVIIQDFPESPVAPSFSLLREMVSTLIERKLIVPQSKLLNEFEDKFAYPKTNVEMNKMEFSINIKNFESNEVIEYLLSPKLDLNCFESELIVIWKIIAVEECKMFLQFCLNYVDFPYYIEDKAQVIFESILNNFSTAQVFGLINRCLGYATKEFQAGKLSRNSAGQYMMGIIQNQVDKAINNGWNLTKYFRPRELPESQLSRFFFYRILDIEELGFNNLIHVKNLKR